MSAGAPARPPLVLATELPGARGGLAIAAATATELAVDGRAAVLAEVGASKRRGPTVLASAEARLLEERLRAAGHASAVARGHLCWLALDDGEDVLEHLGEALYAAESASAFTAHVPARLWPAALEDSRAVAGLLRAELPAERSLAALAVGELRERGLRARVATRPLGHIASRRALAGVSPGGAASARVARLARGLVPPGRPRVAGQAGQALPLTLGAAFAVIFLALVLATLGGAVTKAALVQRGADLAALSGARSLRDDLPRLLLPQMDRREYLDRARAAALEAAEHNDLDAGRITVSFPDEALLVPVRVRVEVVGTLEAGTGNEIPIEAAAEAGAAPPAGYDGMPAIATGGGYAGPLAYRQGKPMRPDVAAAFDRMARAARVAGIGLVVTSAYRSDAEQARLFAANPDPRRVARPGESLHRCATELDLGPPEAYGWLTTNAGRFGFLRRYSWEPWHFGYTRAPPPCSVVGEWTESGSAEPDGRSGGLQGLPGFVPASYRGPIVAAASRWDVSAGLLAAQLMAESGFDPNAISPAGARGIAQFMPATGAAYGLRDPFDPPAAIDAQARLMSALLEEFGSVALALAAYNAGPAAVENCACVPDYPETQAYVARIIGLMGAAGDPAAPPLEVRLVA